MSHGGARIPPPIRGILAAVVVAALPSAESAGIAVHHRLGVAIDPEVRAISATDELTLPEGVASQGTFTFTLHGGLKPSTTVPGASLTLVAAEIGGVAAETWRAVLPKGARTFTLSYGGVIDHPIEQVGEEYARGQRETLGRISREGVFLTGGSRWYPVIAGAPVTLSLGVTLPAGWDAVAPGVRTDRAGSGSFAFAYWWCPTPVDEIVLSAGMLKEYSRDAGRLTAMVFLRTPDDALAGRYLDAVSRYLPMYESLIGPYLFGKFAVVENFWETGYGMPSFTLLGPTVLRLPFIPISSLPHEILHDWWGSGVLVDYASGNWAEGLTAYLADHLMKEQQGSAAEYRETTLQKYADYVLSARDFPLTEFRSRTGSVTEAVGYGKSMMLFHVLRREIGDPAFIEGLRALYIGNRGKTTGWAGVQRAFEIGSAEDLSGFFAQWTTRAGAPELRIAAAEVRPADDGWSLRLAVEQLQAGDPYALRVPVAVTLDGMEKAETTILEMTGRRAEASLVFPSRPVRIDVDPAFDLFRRLDRAEVPPALSQCFGAERAAILLPSGAPNLKEAYAELAEALSHSGPGKVRIVTDSEVASLPADESVWILGWENRFLPSFAEALAGLPAALGTEEVRLERTAIRRKGHCVVVAARHPANPALAILFVAVDDPAAAPGLGRKLPHYQKYSYLAFEGTEPANVAKGRWPVVGSPLTVFVDPVGAGGAPALAALPGEVPLAQLPSPFSEYRMRMDIAALTAEEMWGRGTPSDGITAAAGYVAQGFERAGLAKDDGGWLQPFRALVGEGASRAAHTQLNVVGLVRGRDPALRNETVVVGAHYDGVGAWRRCIGREAEGRFCPGADDNASGVAVLLELARLLAAAPAPDRTILFAAFAGEEEDRQGSKALAERLLARRDASVFGMVNLDTVGRLGKGKLLVIGASSAPEWVHIFRGAGFVTGVETQVLSQDLDASDDVSFREVGVPAVQLFAGPHADYHRPTDTLARIDSNGLVKVAAVAKEVVEYLAGKNARLTPAGVPAASGATVPAGERKVSFGAVPDFAFDGPGVRLTGVVPGSPAERAGLREGDVVTALDGVPIADLRALSAALKMKAAGDKVSVAYRRGARTVTVEVVLEAR